MSYIDEIFLMDRLFNIEKQVSNNCGFPLLNVSHWDSSDLYQKYMAERLVLPTQSLPWNYYYTYSISECDRKKVLINLGVDSKHLDSAMGLLLQSSTIAIVNIVNLLKQHNKKRLCILQPAYFSVPLCCTMFSLDYGIESHIFDNNYPEIPVKKIIAGNYDCLWITSPIFSTSYYPDDRYMQTIKDLHLLGITLIFDESLALPGKELIRSIAIDKNIFAIYSPHKAISINGLKFSVIVCHKIYEDFLEQWVDVFAGALGCSNRDAIFHYISDNYMEECYPAYMNYITHSKNNIEKIIKEFSIASLLPNTVGHYINVSINMKAPQNDVLIKLMENMINKCLVSFIPSTINGFSVDDKLSFRINLTKNSNELEMAIYRIMAYFNSILR